jgi:hypothetical protein
MDVSLYAMQIIEDMTLLKRNQVASGCTRDYVVHIDLAGRLGRFASPFALGRTCSYLSPNFEDRCVMICDVA